MGFFKLVRPCLIIKMKELLKKIWRTLNRKSKKILHIINPKIDIPKLEYKKNLSENPKIAIVGLGPQGHKLALYLSHMGYNVFAICDMNRRRLLKLANKAEIPPF